MRLLVQAARAAVMAIATSAGSLAAAAPVQIVAAENFYGDIAAQIGGPRVAVHSILNNPQQDPHMFEASPSVARALTHAHLVIYNGAGYDPCAALRHCWRSVHRCGPTDGGFLQFPGQPPLPITNNGPAGRIGSAVVEIHPLQR